jgi:hypothetical protein
MAAAEPAKKTRVEKKSQIYYSYTPFVGGIEVFSAKCRKNGGLPAIDHKSRSHPNGLNSALPI